MPAGTATLFAPVTQEIFLPTQRITQPGANGR